MEYSVTVTAAAATNKSSRAPVSAPPSGDLSVKQLKAEAEAAGLKLSQIVGQNGVSPLINGGDGSPWLRGPSPFSTKSEELSKYSSLPLPFEGLPTHLRGRRIDGLSCNRQRAGSANLFFRKSLASACLSIFLHPTCLCKSSELPHPLILPPCLLTILQLPSLMPSCRPVPLLAVAAWSS